MLRRSARRRRFNAPAPPRVAARQTEEAEQDRDGERRTGVTAQGDPGGNRGDEDREASDAREHTEIASQRVLRELLDQVCAAGDSLGFGASIQFVREDAVGGALQMSPTR
jgi:hypothetical protein